MQFPGRRADAADLAQAFGHRRPPRVDGQERHRPPARRRLARQLRLRAAGRQKAWRGAASINDCMRDELADEPRFTPLATVPLQDGKLAARGAGRGDGQGLRRRDDRHAAQGQRAAISTTARSIRSGQAASTLERRFTCTPCSSAASRGSPTTTSSTPSAAWPTPRSRCRGCCSRATCSSSPA